MKISNLAGSDQSNVLIKGDEGLSEDQLMRKYQITRVPDDRFHYRFYRYSRLGDALAQAKRDQ